MNSNWERRASKLTCGFLDAVQNLVGNSKIHPQMGWQDPSVPFEAFAVEDIVVDIDKVPLSLIDFVGSAVASSFVADGTAAVAEPSSPSAHLLGVLCCWTLQMGPVVQMDCS